MYMQVCMHVAKHMFARKVQETIEMSGLCYKNAVIELYYKRCNYLLITLNIAGQ